MVLADHLQRLAAPAGGKRSYTSPTPAGVSRLVVDAYVGRAQCSATTKTCWGTWPT